MHVFKINTALHPHYNLLNYINVSQFSHRFNGYVWNRKSLLESFPPQLFSSNNLPLNTSYLPHNILPVLVFSAVKRLNEVTHRKVRFVTINRHSHFIFIWWSLCAHQAWSPKPHLTAKPRKNKANKNTRCEHILCSPDIWGTKFQLCHIPPRTHPEDNKTDSSD